MSTPKVKGIFKGFRYITQMFDNEKEPEMQIGLPTDVKHVAHIGWDGPSVNTPSWMNEFKSPSSYSSAPISLSGSIKITEPDNAIKWISEDSRSTSSLGRDVPELPKSSRRQSTGSVTDSPTREKSDKPRQSRKSSKPARVPASLDQNQGSESPRGNLPDIPKKSRRKKSKENSGAGAGGGPSKCRLKASHLDPNSGFGSPVGPDPKSNKEQRPVEGGGQSGNGSSEKLLRNLV
ncbi:CRIB domain-containing protein RIC6-like [Prosopis cineraria]|uniref:CRIB domain-containing protein RIC6-like n=1 Tax=Prosopis cineraria TaxID=364024 RepID=UPI0024108ADD|nr:CRIB domain-containing protein RIC6-like [Prosopis cineraria]